MRGDDRETLRLSHRTELDRADGVDTQKRKPAQKTTFGKKIIFSPEQRTNHRYNSLMMPTPTNDFYFCIKL